MKKILFLFFAVVLLCSCAPSQTYTVTLAGYNYTERPISGYSVDGAGGGNMFANDIDGGTGWACCAEVTVGKPVHIRWTFTRTKSQFEAGLPIEHHEMDVMVPKPEGAKQPEYMEVHFYSRTHIELRLVSFPGRARWPPGTDMSKLTDY
jgi:hypothetical protein